jgi:hypothetical protein
MMSGSAIAHRRRDPTLVSIGDLPLGWQASKEIVEVPDSIAHACVRQRSARL